VDREACDSLPRGPVGMQLQGPPAAGPDRTRRGEGSFSVSSGRIGISGSRPGSHSQHAAVRIFQPRCGVRDLAALRVDSSSDRLQRNWWMIYARVTADPSKRWRAVAFTIASHHHGHTGTLWSCGSVAAHPCTPSPLRVKRRSTLMHARHTRH
jgi:hypothetical protein